MISSESPTHVYRSTVLKAAAFVTQVIVVYKCLTSSIGLVCLSADSVALTTGIHARL